MNKKLLAVLFLGVFAFSVIMPAGRVVAETSNISLEAFQKQIEYLTGLIKDLQAQLDALRGGQTQPVPMPVPSPKPDQGWESYTGVLSALSTNSQWGTHTLEVKYVPDPNAKNSIDLYSSGYTVKAVNDDVLAQLKKYEGQKVTLWGQKEKYTENGTNYLGFIAKKVYPEGYGCILPAKVKIGSKGDDVKIVQQYLANDKQVYPEGLVTGYYGQLTKKAVERFQEKNGLTATGELDDRTRTKIEGVVAPTMIGSGQIYPCPLPKPKPIPDQGIKVYSPSMGESWQLGQTYKIAWSQVWPTFGCTNKTGGQPGVPVCVDPGPNTFAPIGPITITLHKYIACLYEGPVRCMMMEIQPYVIADKIDNNGYFAWTVPADLASQYQGKVVITVSAISGGFNGQSGVFTIGSGVTTDNKPPVVSGVSGPTNLKVGETGTWAVKAYDPEGGSLSYSVLWGDESVMALGGATAPRTMSAQNTATFTHSYSVAGNYTPVFYVTDDHNQTAKTSMSVMVGNSTATNHPPKIVGFPAIPSQIIAGQQVGFTWTAADSDSDYLTWDFNWGDSPYDSEYCSPIFTPRLSDGSYNHCTNLSASHTWSQAGTYTTKVTVSDGRGGSDSYSFNVNVIAVTNN